VGAVGAPLQQVVELILAGEEPADGAVEPHGAMVSRI
jgi:hypothetical protein